MAIRDQDDALRRDRGLAGGALAGTERLAALRLIRSRRVGPTTWHRLLAEHGGAAAALAVLPEVAARAGAEAYEPCPEEVARAEVRRGQASGARLLLHGDADYPAALGDLPDAPPALWVIGDVARLRQPMVAVIGARNCSSLGTRMARHLAEGLGAAGVAVVSGLARGVDAAAHEAALPTGTVAVMAGGVDLPWPQENADLAVKIRAGGLLLSEQPPGLQPQARHFPQRNRIVSGLSRAVVVVEAAGRSGSLITAGQALDQGREVMAVPGHPFDPRAAGCNQLLRDGALLVRGARDVLEALDLSAPAAVAPQRPRPVMEAPPSRPAPSSALAEASRLHGMILSRLGPSPLAEDQLIRDLAMPPSLLAPELLMLELDGRIRRQPGGLLSLP